MLVAGPADWDEAGGSVSPEIFQGVVFVVGGVGFIGAADATDRAVFEHFCPNGLPQAGFQIVGVAGEPKLLNFLVTDGIPRPGGSDFP